MSQYLVILTELFTVRVGNSHSSICCSKYRTLARNVRYVNCFDLLFYDKQTRLNLLKLSDLSKGKKLICKLMFQPHQFDNIQTNMTMHAWLWCMSNRRGLLGFCSIYRLHLKHKQHTCTYIHCFDFMMAICLNTNLDHIMSTTDGIPLTTKQDWLLSTVLITLSSYSDACMSCETMYELRLHNVLPIKVDLSKPT